MFYSLAPLSLSFFSFSFILSHHFFFPLCVFVSTSVFCSDLQLTVLFSFLCVYTVDCRFQFYFFFVCVFLRFHCCFTFLVLFFFSLSVFF